MLQTKGTEISYPESQSGWRQNPNMGLTEGIILQLHFTRFWKSSVVNTKAFRGVDFLEAGLLQGSYKTSAIKTLMLIVYRS